MTPKLFRSRLSTTAFAFRGYNHTNLGRSNELLNHPKYGDIVKRRLIEASTECSSIVGRRMDLLQRVQTKTETEIADYADAIALIVTMELAQIELLREFFDIDYSKAKMAMGYSLGEITALIASGVIDPFQALAVPLQFSDDCIALASDVTLGVLFSRGLQLPLDAIRKGCLEVNCEGAGVVGISTYLAPNSILVMGQGKTLDRLLDTVQPFSEDRIYLRKNESDWPPLHTPIVWNSNIPNRCAVAMHTMQGGFVKPTPNVFSLVTGAFSYNDYNAREILHRWTDHAQRLWDGVYETLAGGVDTVAHLGPSPNIFPATYKRLSDNVAVQTKRSMGLRAMSNVVNRPWLQSLLPARTALLRAPMIKQIIVEDWLLDHEATT